MFKESKPIRIGIDLDNTVISYDKAFQLAAVEQGLIEQDSLLDKKTLRDEIRKRPNGEFEWQKLQGYVYGKGIHKAVLFPGVYRFLWRCHKRKIEVEVVSHKTDFGHFDHEKYSLREAATNFLIKKGLLNEKCPLIKEITYKSSKEAKINYIKQNNYEWFIDDLEEILFSPELEQQKGILFTLENVSTNNSNKVVARTWEQISQTILNSWCLKEVKDLIETIDNTLYTDNIEKLHGRGNSIIYKLYLPNGRKSALKIYPETSYHDRLKSEFTSTKILNNLDISNVQIPISSNKDLGVATYEWIEGERVTKYGKKEISQALSFLSILQDNSTKPSFKNFPMAADACPSGVDIENQIKRRLSQLDEAMNKYAELDKFLRDEFNPLFNEIISWSQAAWPSNYDYKKAIERKELILSPSDFGFHNALLSQAGILTFHDFEYFGWDDPVKLIADFSHHAAMNLSEEIELLWFSGVSEIYGKHLLSRLSSAWPLYGLNWCLIILNEFKDEVWSRRCAADDSIENLRDELLSTQLAKSRNKLNSLAQSYKNKYYW